MHRYFNSRVDESIFMSSNSPGRFPTVPDEQVPGELSQSARFVARVILGFAVVCILAVLAAQRFVPDQRSGLPELAEVILPDGSRAVVLAVTTGTSHQFEMIEHTTWIDWLSRRSGKQTLRIKSGSPSIMVWVARKQRHEERGVAWPDLRHAQLEVAGETIAARNAHLFYRAFRMPSYLPIPASVPIDTLALLKSPRVGSSELLAFDFPQIPAGLGDLKLSLLGAVPVAPHISSMPALRLPAPVRPVLASFQLSEPPGLPLLSTGKPSPLPAIARSGPWTLTLNDLRFETSVEVPGSEPSVQHRFQYDVALSSADGNHPCEITSYGPVIDAAGNSFPSGYRNQAPLRFGPHQLNITTTVPLSTAEQATARASSPALEIPGRGAARALSDTVTLDGGKLRIDLKAVGGPGFVTHADPLASSAIMGQLVTSDIPPTFQITRKRSASGNELTVESTGFHLLYSVSGVSSNERLRIVSVTDDRGKPVEYREVAFDGIRCVMTASDAMARSIQVEWAFDRLATFSFTVSPPTVPAKVP